MKRDRVEQILLFIALAFIPISAGLYMKGEVAKHTYPEACYVRVS